MKNTKCKNQKGFTLVELAIVLTIVGLLIGGILKGQQLMLNARVTATVAQIKGFEAAVTSFRDAYGALPGDLKNTDIKIEGCDSTICKTNSDGSVGDNDWDMETYQPAKDTDLSTGDAGMGEENGDETLVFWYSLEKAGLVSAVTADGIKGTKDAFGKSIPKAKVGGGFWAGNSLNGKFSRPTGSTKYTLFGTIITLVGTPATDLVKSSKGGPLTADIAANMDRKIDDGLPDVGSVQAYGDPATCYNSINNPPYSYNEGASTSDCGLHIRIQQ